VFSCSFAEALSPAVLRLKHDHPLMQTNNAARKSLDEWWPQLVKHMNNTKKPIARAQKEFPSGTPEAAASLELQTLAGQIFAPLQVRRKA
jgi:hypothetical protein